MPHAFPLAALALAAALALHAPSSDAAAVDRQAATARQRPDATPPMRLSSQVRPQSTTLALTLDPAQPVYSGQVVIALQLSTATRDITLHAKDLRIGQAQVAVGARTLTAQVSRVDAERVRLRLPQTVPAGAAQLSISFQATLQEQDVYGFFRQRDGAGGPWLAITQFEAAGARLAFPLFDEPGWKLPWTVSLTVPEALTALSNTPVASSTPAERPGWKTVRFQTTPPLPSYLLAMAVGEFDAAEAGTVGGPVAGGAGPADAGGVPMRFITPRGRAAESAYAASVTGPIVQRLEDYFGMPFPYAKLDSLAIPVTVSFGAMEHPGLVTYASNLLLARPGEQTRRFERGYTVTAAHELAHQWFGNLVTMAWWDDLWLNESFASWMEVRITDEVKPAWGYALEHQRARAQAMRADRLVSARRIQQPVLSDDDMGNLFDTITYQKGHSVLAMFEAWLGEQRFRDGVRRYMQRHAWGNARTDDFLAALGETEPTLPDALRSFTQQPGIPLLRVTLDCPAGGRPQLKLAQQRLLPLGSTGQSGAPQRWQIPLRVRTPAGDSRLLLREAEDTLALPDTDCPAWVQPNAGGQGYYRVAQGADALLRLAAAPGLGDAEVLALLDDAQGLHEAGELDSASLLALVQRFADHPRRQVVTQAAELLASLQRLVGPAQRDAYAARWQAAFGARARQLGWLAKPGEAEDDTLLRDRLLPWLADLGQDQALRAEARRLAGAWLVDRNALPAAQRGSVLEVAAIAADDALFDALLAATRSTPQRNERRDLLQALGQARAPAQAERARALLLSTALDLRETLWSVLGEQARHPDTRAAALTWWQQHQAALVKRMGRDEPAELPMLFSAGCSADEDRQLQRSFGPSAARYIGGQANLARARESVALCSAWKLRQPSGL